MPGTSDDVERDGESLEAAPGPHARYRRLAWLPGLLLLLLLVAFVVHHVGEERRFAALVTSSEPSWLLLAAALQVATYLCAGGVWRVLLAPGDVRPPLVDLARLALVKLAVDQLVPTAGVSGTVVVARRLEAEGVSRPAVATVVLGSLVAYFAAYALALLAALGVLWAYHDLNDAVLGLALVFTLAAAGIISGILWLERMKRWTLPDWLKRRAPLHELLQQAPSDLRSTVGDLRVMAPSVGLNLAIFVLDAGTLVAMLRALGDATAPAAAFASFVVASAAATIAFVPGGLGTFEATEVAMLTLLGTTVEAALAATLLLRGFTFWIPMAVGLLVARRGRRSRR